MKKFISNLSSYSYFFLSYKMNIHITYSTKCSWEDQPIYLSFNNWDNSHEQCIQNLIYKHPLSFRGNYKSIYLIGNENELHESLAELFGHANEIIIKNDEERLYNYYDIIPGMTIYNNSNKTCVKY